MRAKIVKGALGFIFLFLGLAVFNLEVMQAKKFKSLSDRNCIRLLSQPSARGRIFDRRGELIVGNELCYDVTVLSEGAERIDSVLARIAGILAMDPKHLKDEFKANYIAASIPVVIAQDISHDKVVALEELKMELPGVVIQPRPQRVYPYGSLACHAIGYLGAIDRWRLTKLADYGYKTKDIVGFGGVEERYDYYLRRDEGALSVEVDSKGRFVRMLGFKPPRNGRDIQLTLDLNIQKIVEARLQDRKGSVIIMEPYSGEILAMASRPDFNPALFIKKPNSSLGRLFSDRDAPLINRSISGLYAPGSVFKIIVAAAAFETGKIKGASAFFCKGSIKIGNQEFSCWNTHGSENLVAAIAHSCNVFFYRTGLLVGAMLIHDYAVKFGLSKATAIDLPYEASGVVPSPLRRRIYKFKSWFDGDTANFSIGQGELLVSPIQITRLMAALVNGGLLLNPYILKTVDGRDLMSYQKKVNKLALGQDSIDIIKHGLKSAVSDANGTANILSGLPVKVAGKTGTAQVVNAQPHGWFVGFFPSGKPKFVICVLLEQGGSGYTAVLLTKQIIEDMAREGLI